MVHIESNGARNLTSNGVGAQSVYGPRPPKPEEVLEAALKFPSGWRHTASEARPPEGKKKARPKRRHVFLVQHYEQKRDGVLTRILRALYKEIPVEEKNSYRSAIEGNQTFRTRFRILRRLSPRVRTIKTAITEGSGN